MKRFLFHNKPMLALLVLLQTIYAAGFVGFALVIQQVVNVAAAGHMGAFLAWVGGSFGYLAAFLVVMLAKSAVQSRYVNEGVRKMRDALTARLLSMRYEEFGKHDSAKYLSHLTNDMNTVAKNFFESAVTVPEEVTCFVLAVAAAFFVNYIIALTMLGLTVLVLLVPLLFNRPMNKANIRLSEDVKAYTQLLKQTFLGYDVVKNFNSAARVGGEIAAGNAALTRSSTRAAKLGAYAMDLGICIVVTLQLGTVAVAGALIIQGTLLIGALFAAVQLGNNLFSPIMNISGKMTLIGGVRELNATLLSILDVPAETGSKELCFRRELTLRDVTYRYPGEEEDALSGVSASFSAGGKYLIVGRSGSGKSTLLKLVAKMYHGYTGAIELDGAEYAGFTEPDLYEILAIAQQRSYLFRKTVRDNIDFNGTGDAARLRDAVRLSCLDGFLERCDNGLDTVIDEEVNQISGGEKLRIGLARALYRGGALLLLDEVTSALDKDTAHAVEENVLGLAGVTVLNVSHRIHPDLLSRYTGVFVMEDGRIVDGGSPERVAAGQALQKYLVAEAG